MRKYQELSLEQIIEQMRVDESSSDDFCLYGKEDGELALDRLYWVSDYPDVVEDRDVYPTDVAKQDLQLVYYGEQLFDVLSVALEEKPDASCKDLVEALNYYQEHDSFMPFEP
ncbi:hypothetical protein GEZ89_02245 [Streptococcus mitis]|uniref:DUF7716 domain-containing protein n=1 Tax=Streptococcus mitis TaxID=28037 RepID=A0A7X1RLY0_STRMT|nr:hypothetical protein [Streptococcus mitis]MQQ51805.1 hypothetical protein [Streptococcus mitis]